MAPLVDTHARTFGRLRISVTDRCNFACVYCRPESGLAFEEKLLSFDEITAVATVAVRLGLTRIRLTGGEPLVRPNLPALVSQLRAIEGLDEITLTTNAALLPQLAKPLKSAGLSRVNISLDSLRQDTTEKIARVDVLSKVLAGIDAAIENDLTPLRLNAVVMRGLNDDELPDLVRYAHSKRAIMRFIEYMPMGTARFNNATTVPVAEMKQNLANAGFDLHHVKPTDPSEPARLWLCSRTGAKVGFISSITDHFCSTCDRMRLTADGFLRPCLHQDFEVDLRPHLHSSPALENAFRQAAQGKWPGHRMTAFTPLYSKREMISIGG